MTIPSPLEEIVRRVEEALLTEMMAGPVGRGTITVSVSDVFGLLRTVKTASSAIKAAQAMGEAAEPFARAGVGSDALGKIRPVTVRAANFSELAVIPGEAFRALASAHAAFVERMKNG